MRVAGITWPTVTVEMTVGKGFYVRSFARDYAEALGTTGYLTALRRTSVGPFQADHATGPYGQPLPMETVTGPSARSRDATMKSRAIGTSDTTVAAIGSDGSASKASDVLA